MRNVLAMAVATALLSFNLFAAEAQKAPASEAPQAKPAQVESNTKTEPVKGEKHAAKAKKKSHKKVGF